MKRLPSAVVFAMLVSTASAESARAAGDDDWFHPGRSMQAAAKTLAEGHISHRPLDDKLSREWFDAFFLRLDPQRMYFLATDLREFEPLAERLDDLAKEGNIKFPLLVRRCLQERVAEAAKVAEAAVRTDHDYTVDESVPRRYETFAATVDERVERWRLRIKLEMLIERKICHLDGPLGEAETVELQLLHPKTLERVTLEVHRSLRRRRD